MPDMILYISEELNKKLATLADKLNISKKDVIYRILNEYKLEKKE